MKTFSYTFLIVFIAILTASPTWAGTVTLTWDPNIESDMAGYKVYHGTASGSYTMALNAGNVTQYTVNNLTDGQTYYFAVTAYDTSGNESGYSNEVSTLIGITGGGGGGGGGASSGGGGCGMIRNISNHSGVSPHQTIFNLVILAFLISLGKMQVQLKKLLGKRLLA